MAYLLDSNILVRFLHRPDPDHTHVRTAIRNLSLRGEQLYYTTQNIREFWNVCTRPTTARGGYGLSIAITHRRARLIKRRLTLLPDSIAVHEEWLRLVVAHSVIGVQVHDARLVAAMRTHGITHILTFNTSDFARYPGITAVHP